MGFMVIDWFVSRLDSTWREKRMRLSLEMKLDWVREGTLIGKALTERIYEDPKEGVCPRDMPRNREELWKK